jgi:hypothetical protein
MNEDERSEIEVGRLLRAGISGFVIGCPVSQLDILSFGALVSSPQGDDYLIYGLIHEVRIEDDSLVRQLVTSEAIEETVIADNRLNRNVPLEVSVLSVGYRQAGRIYHLLPPRPPLSLDKIYLCGSKEIRQFTSAGQFGYFRHLLRAADQPTSDLLATHLQLAAVAHHAAGDNNWLQRATQELIILLRDDYPVLMTVLSALQDLQSNWTLPGCHSLKWSGMVGSPAINRFGAVSGEKGSVFINPMREPGSNEK